MEMIVTKHHNDKCGKFKVRFAFPFGHHIHEQILSEELEILDHQILALAFGKRKHTRGKAHICALSYLEE
ncbi:unnamed protein product [Sphenostylis stenocarpa]|uniref:Uncharacterized protein n=1 Tax=Sphenostylis stenocarpa TaxID=92480 RepID=A0AA86V8T2_9FABA|nr:unnamed protein product [Sphenostylis stenocarpa]